MKQNDQEGFYAYALRAPEPDSRKREKPTQVTDEMIVPIGDPNPFEITESAYTDGLGRKNGSWHRGVIIIPLAALLFATGVLAQSEVAGQLFQKEKSAAQNLTCEVYRLSDYVATSGTVFKCGNRFLAPVVMEELTKLPEGHALFPLQDAEEIREMPDGDDD